MISHQQLVKEHIHVKPTLRMIVNLPFRSSRGKRCSPFHVAKFPKKLFHLIPLLSISDEIQITIFLPLNHAGAGPAKFLGKLKELVKVEANAKPADDSQR